MDCWLELHPAASHSPDCQLDDLFRMLRCAVRDGVMSVEEVYASINTAFVGRPPAEFLACVKRRECGEADGGERCAE